VVAACVRPECGWFRQRWGTRQPLDPEGLAGQGQEHLVELGRAQRQVFDFEAAVIEGPQRRHQPLHPHADVARHPAGGLVDDRRGVAGARQAREDGRYRRQIRAVADMDLDHLGADTLLELRRAAVGHGPTVVDDHDAAGQVVGRVRYWPLCRRVRVRGESGLGVADRRGSATGAGHRNDPRYLASLPPERFPHTVAAADLLVGGLPEVRFEFGLAVILRGLASYAADAKDDLGK
jgi:hypothetical protein